MCSMDIVSRGLDRRDSIFYHSLTVLESSGKPALQNFLLQAESLIEKPCPYKESINEIHAIPKSAKKTKTDTKTFTEQSNLHFSLAVHNKMIPMS